MKISHVLRKSGIDPEATDLFFDACKAGFPNDVPTVKYSIGEDVLIRSFEELYRFFVLVSGSFLGPEEFKIQFEEEVRNILCMENHFQITLNTEIETNGLNYFDSLFSFYGSFAKSLLKRYIREYDYSYLDDLKITKYALKEHKQAAIQRGEMYLGTPQSYWMASGGAGDYMEARNLLWLTLPSDSDVELDRYLSYAIIDHKGFARSETNSISRSRMTTRVEQIVESIEAQPAFMFCCAKDQKNTVQKDFGYDDSYELTNVSGILKAVSAILEEIFGEVTAIAGIVNYQDKPEVFTSEDTLYEHYEKDRFMCHDEYFLNLSKVDSYFLKPCEYSSQQEFRMIWMPTEFLGHKKAFTHNKVISGGSDHILFSDKEIASFLL
jgi:hypothetical protein